MLDAARMVSLLRRLMHGLVTFLFPEMAARYRPEDHYIRGPGPKWRAKDVAD
jgi:hypothetical protein